MPKNKKSHSKSQHSKKSKAPAFEKSGNPAEWLQEPPLVCDAVRMEPELDPWEKKGKVVRQEHTTEDRRKKLSELSINVEHFIADESGAA
jgi:hypothetical protein